MSEPLAFSDAHMALLEATPASGLPDPQRASWWLGLASPALSLHAGRRVRQRGVSDGEQEDVASDAVVRVFERALAGDYSGLPRDVDARHLVFSHIDNHIRAHCRRAQKTARHHVEPTRLDHVTAPESPVTDHAQRELWAREAALIRSLQTSPIQRLLLLLHVHPELLEDTDVYDAVQVSSAVHRGTQTRWDGLTRGLPDTLALLRAWLPDATADMPQGHTIRLRPASRAQLAWILRGPQASHGPADWSPVELRRALNWLDQNLSRSRARLRACVSAEHAGAAPASGGPPGRDATPAAAPVESGHALAMNGGAWMQDEAGVAASPPG